MLKILVICVSLLLSQWVYAVTLENKCIGFFSVRVKADKPSVPLSNNISLKPSEDMKKAKELPLGVPYASVIYKYAKKVVESKPVEVEVESVSNFLQGKRAGEANVQTVVKVKPQQSQIGAGNFLSSKHAEEQRISKEQASGNVKAPLSKQIEDKDIEGNRHPLKEVSDNDVIGNIKSSEKMKIADVDGNTVVNKDQVKPRGTITLGTKKSIAKKAVEDKPLAPKRDFMSYRKNIDELLKSKTISRAVFGELESLIESLLRDYEYMSTSAYTAWRIGDMNLKIGRETTAMSAYKEALVLHNANIAKAVQRGKPIKQIHLFDEVGIRVSMANYHIEAWKIIEAGDISTAVNKRHWRSLIKKNMGYKISREDFLEKALSEFDGIVVDRSMHEIQNIDLFVMLSKIDVFMEFGELGKAVGLAQEIIQIYKELGIDVVGKKLTLQAKSNIRRVFHETVSQPNPFWRHRIFRYAHFKFIEAAIEIGDIKMAKKAIDALEKLLADKVIWTNASDEAKLLSFRTELSGVE
ncbi:MAG: hypothetical protein HOO06_05320 [Bdellovibrionaceae bacterium]|jgi:hypothetical protein|nr:hypothetical protein [Pseudobdellovibrionaceae bacterium]